jgi:C1A family cysteine protease
MKYAVAALLGLVAAVEKDTEIAFVHWMSQHGKSYATKEEYMFRLSTFAKKMDFIEHHNSLNEDDHLVGMNHLMDFTDAEYKKLLGYKNHRRHQKREMRHHKHVEAVKDVPASIDWREKGAVTPVKNQGQCGSCWSFSATGAMEGAYQIAGNELTSFSEQQLVDCSTAQGNNGCNGGLMDYAFTFAEQNAMDTESSYPYKARDGKCDSSITGVAKVTGFTDVTPKSPAALQTALAQGPVSIAIDASGIGFQLYHSGILKRFCGTSLDHGVLAVGYGTEGSTDFWIVKNSWGSSWGEHGYVRILRTMDKQDAGVCGLQLDASYPSF